MKFIIDSNISFGSESDVADRVKQFIKILEKIEIKPLKKMAYISENKAKIVLFSEKYNTLDDMMQCVAGVLMQCQNEIKDLNLKINIYNYTNHVLNNVFCELVINNSGEIIYANRVENNNITKVKTLLELEMIEEANDLISFYLESLNFKVENLEQLNLLKKRINRFNILL